MSLLPLIAFAFADPTALTGQYTISTDPSAVEAAQQAELQRTLATLPSLLRPVAEPMLKPTLFYCRMYQMVVSLASFTTQCDDKPQLTRPFSGDPVPLTVGDITFTSRVSAEGDQVILTLDGAHGSRVTRYIPNSNGMHVDVSVTSPRLDAPMTWGIEYRRR
jgi:hypothetical protein